MQRRQQPVSMPSFHPRRPAPLESPPPSRPPPPRQSALIRRHRHRLPQAGAPALAVTPSPDPSPSSPPPSRVKTAPLLTLADTSPSVPQSLTITVASSSFDPALQTLEAGVASY
ncbi:hypothetical protein GQ55_1G146000 [Panicum hallii var. hallii]|uniref:Uncharacterized protein n=1 Tax=Panicum hallii var. hallii TaxID=1504633 RepID=A0A2T7F5B2_9POAL|nr:hypothetical protein GQ55_1G146000 [Panicum hallii var. hallii]